MAGARAYSWQSVNSKKWLIATNEFFWCVCVFLNLQADVGMDAINDSFFTEAAIYKLLKKHIASEPYYVNVMELFHEVKIFVFIPAFQLFKFCFSFFLPFFSSYIFQKTSPFCCNIILWSTRKIISKTNCGDTMWNLNWVVISSEKELGVQLNVSISKKNNTKFLCQKYNAQFLLFVSKSSQKSYFCPSRVKSGKVRSQVNNKRWLDVRFKSSHRLLSDQLWRWPYMLCFQPSDHIPDRAWSVLRPDHLARR